MQPEQKVPRSINNPAQAFLSVPTPLIITTLSDGRYVEVNDAFLSATGFRRDEVIGRPDVELNVWPDGNERGLFTQKLKEQGRVTGQEINIRVKSGELRSGLLSAALIELSGEQCVVALWHDITERKRAEAEIQQFSQELENRVKERTAQLQESEDRFRAQYKGQPLATFSWQKLGDEFFLYDYNDAARDMSQGRVVDFVGVPATKFFPDRPDLIEDLWRCYREKTVIRKTMPYRMRTTGENKQIIATAAFIPPDLVMVHAEDITERAQMEAALREKDEQLRQSQKMETIGILAGGIAHDFNNILAPIIGYTDMAQKTLPPDSRARSDLDRVVKAAQRAKDLVSQILAFSRKEEQKPQLVQMHLIVREVIKFLRPSLPATIEIRERLDARSGTVLADPTKLHQVLMNLCTNAYDAMRQKGGVLQISLDTVEVDAGHAEAYPSLNEGAYVRLTVGDTGHGMDRDTMARVFEPFFTTKGVGEGTGLGLSVAYGIVASSGGAITIDSEPGKGSAFHVYLPQADGGSKPETPTEEAIPRAKEHILFADGEYKG